jgi:hypothetical protein
MKHITTIEGLSFEVFDAWLKRDWSTRIFPPAEWHGHLLDTPAPVKMEAHPKTLIEAGWTFTQQIGADHVRQVGWVYIAKTAKGIKIESDMQPPHDRNFVEWIGLRFGASAQPADEAQTAETTPEAASQEPTMPAQHQLTHLVQRTDKGAPQWWADLDAWWTQHCDPYTWSNLAEKTGYSQPHLKAQLTSKTDAKKNRRQ